MEHTEYLAPYTLAWSDGVFPLGEDALALGAFSTVRPRWRICDLGTGSGALLLLLARRDSTLALHGVELDPLSAQTARENLARNGLDGTIHTGDLRESPFSPGVFDLAVSNPPYFPVGAGTPGSPARSEIHCSLEELCQAAARLVRSGGRFALCHRPERLTDLLCTLRACGLEPKRMQFAAHTADAPPSLVLVEAVRQGRPGLTVLPPLLRKP